MKNNNFLIEIDELEFSQTKDIYNDNIEVSVTFEDGFCLNVIVGTLQNMHYLMEKDEVNFWKPCLPWVIVKKLTREIIYEAIHAYKDARPNGYWLKLYYFAPDIDITVFDQLQAQEIKEAAELELLVGLDDLKADINKLDKLEKSEKLNLVARFEKLYTDVSILTKEEESLASPKFKARFKAELKEELRRELKKESET
jgi:hypothetical protein